MLRKSFWLIVAMVALASLFAASAIYAGSKVDDVIKLEDPSYKHTKGIVELSHKKHSEDYAKKYPEFYKNGCGECHHDAQGKPLALKVGDDVQRCVECHKKPGRAPKRKKGEPRLSKKERLEYHAEAFHANCKTCHKKYNAKYKPEREEMAPVSCTTCHPRPKKK